jgi:hypothetical protein
MGRQTGVLPQGRPFVIPAVAVAHSRDCGRGLKVRSLNPGTGRRRPMREQPAPPQPKPDEPPPDDDDGDEQEPS